ncbi:acetate--CoA ligase family protein [Rhodobacteraceae bacterium NNCM2]|nr:acetate--CoA ligase family protein [Coraliihabitans acroporae]
MKRDLSRLFRPRSIAVIGGGWGLEVVAQCQKMGFDGEIWPVHPKRDEVHGIPCYRSVADLPGAPDASFIGVNRHLTVEVIAELAARGAGGAVCFASGFAEAEDGREAGAALQARLVEAAGEMPVLGPNCYGLINYLDGALLWPDQHGGTRRDSGVALLTQSSNILINLTMAARGLPIAYALAAGNQAQTSLAEMAMACLDDPRVTAIGLYIEGVADVRAFEELAAKARAAGKPIVALKAGRSEEAQRATLSHTASLAGSDAASRAFLGRLSIPLLDNIPDLLETLKLLHIHGPLAGRDICSVSCSGGEASIAGDAAVGRNLTFRPMTAEQRDEIQATLNPLVTVANPLDYHTFIWGDGERMTATFTAVLKCGFDLTMFVFDFPRADRCSDATWRVAVDAMEAAAKATGAKVAITTSMPENMSEAWAEDIAARGLAPMFGIDATMAAAEAAATIAEGWAAPTPAPVVAASAGEAGPALDERMAKLSLAAHGVTVPEGHVAGTPEEAGKVAARLTGPLALKGLGIAHKTEHGAVRLGLAAAEVEEAAMTMAAPEGYLVEEMVEGGVAELILGVVREAPYGFALTIGAGGILTELLRDSETLLIPSTADEVRAALLRLKTAPLLTGFRGKPAADLNAIVAMAMALQDYVMAEGDKLVELDINPVIATPDRAVAADALIRLMED